MKLKVNSNFPRLRAVRSRVQPDPASVDGAVRSASQIRRSRAAVLPTELGGSPQVTVPSRLILISLLCCGLATPVVAQDILEDEGVPRADDIVVRTRTQRPAEVFQDTPVETEVITREEIERLPARNAADIVRNLPGVRVQQRIQGQSAAVSIEGLPPEYTLLLVDGQIYSGEIGGVGDLADIPLTNVERIEILRGAQALRYGSQASGGVVQLITREPPEDGAVGEVQGGAGDQGFHQAQAVLGYGNEKVAGSAQYFDDAIDGFDAPDDVDAVIVAAGSDSNRINRDGNGVLRWRPTPELDSHTRFGFRREEEHLVFEGGVTGQRIENRWRAIETLEWVGESSRAAGSFLYYRNELETGVGRIFNLEEDQFKVDAVYDRFFATGDVQHALTLGVDGRAESIALDEGSIIFDPSGGTTEIDPVRENIGRGAIFAILESEVTRWLTFEGGVRAEFHSLFDPVAVPQIAALVTPWESLKLRASWGMGHRAPSLRDLYQPAVPQLGGAYFLVGNPDLQTETSMSARGGFEWTPDRRISIAATGFYNEIEDHIRSIFSGSLPIGVISLPVLGAPTTRPGLDLICSATNNGLPECGATVDILRTSPLFAKANLDQVRTQGVEARMELRPNSRIVGQLGYTFLDTEVVDSTLVGLTELPNEARHTIDAALRMDAPVTETSVTLRGRWRAGALTETSGTGLLSFASLERAPDSFILDFRVVQPIRWGLSVYADVFNLTDERVVDSYVVRGTSFFVGVRGQFPW